MMKLHVLLFALIVSGCASSRVEKSTDLTKPSPGQQEATEEQVEVDPSGGEVEEPIVAPPPTVKASSTAVDNLKEAIRQSDDNKIFSAAVEVLAQNPKDARALNALGLIYYKRNDIPAAEYMFTKAAKEEPKSSEVHNNLGLVKLALAKPKEALGYFRKALQLNSRNSNAAANMGSLYVEYRDYVKAELALEIAHSRLSKDFKVVSNYAVALVGVGKYDKAEKLYKEALKLQPSSKEVMFNYAILLIDKKNKSKEGMDLINRLRFLGPSPSMKNKINLLESKAKESLQ